MSWAFTSVNLTNKQTNKSWKTYLTEGNISSTKSTQVNIANQNINTISLFISTRLPLFLLALVRRLRRYEANELGHALLHQVLGLSGDLRVLVQHVLHYLGDVRNWQILFVLQFFRGRVLRHSIVQISENAQVQTTCRLYK